jgi:hypothetical protein
MSHQAQTICLCLTASLLNACVVPFHVDESPPFEDVIPTLIDGQTTRSQIGGVLGQPAASYENGLEWIYTGSQINWEIFYLTPQLSGTDLTGEQHFLILKFDKTGVLKSQQLDICEPDFGRCSVSGICHDAKGNIMRMADSEENALAKTFTAPEGGCSIYLFGAGLGYPGRQHRVVLDGENMGVVFLNNSYFLWHLSPSDYELAVYPQPVTISLECLNNEVKFVEFKLGFWSDSSSRLEIINEQKGRKQISKRRMRMVMQQSDHIDTKRIDESNAGSGFPIRHTVQH